MSHPVIRSWSGIAKDIGTERARQERIKHEGKFEYTCADPEMSDNERLPVLLEEVGEVARAMLEGTNLREELVQVAAVCVAWITAIDQRGEL